MKGIVRKKMKERGFGFIAREGEDDVFFHDSDCISLFDDLDERDAVEFELTEAKGRPRAMKMRRIG